MSFQAVKNRLDLCLEGRPGICEKHFPSFDKVPISYKVCWIVLGQKHDALHTWARECAQHTLVELEDIVEVPLEDDFDIGVVPE